MKRKIKRPNEGWWKGSLQNIAASEGSNLPGNISIFKALRFLSSPFWQQESLDISPIFDRFHTVTRSLTWGLNSNLIGCDLCLNLHHPPLPPVPQHATLFAKSCVVYRGSSNRPWVEAESLRRENKQSTVGNLAGNNLIMVDVWDTDRLQLACLHLRRMGVPAAPLLWHHHDDSALVWPMVLSREGYGEGAHHVNYRKNKAPRLLLICRWLWQCGVDENICTFDWKEEQGKARWTEKASPSLFPQAA